MPHAITESMFRLIKAPVGAAALATFVSLFAPLPAAAQTVCGAAGTGAPLGTATGNFAFVCGPVSQASGDGSVAIGVNTTASGQNSMAIGLGAGASGIDSTASGVGSKARGNYKIGRASCRERV